MILPMKKALRSTWLRRWQEEAYFRSRPIAALLFFWIARRERNRLLRRTLLLHIHEVGRICRLRSGEYCGGPPGVLMMNSIIAVQPTEFADESWFALYLALPVDQRRRRPRIVMTGPAIGILRSGSAIRQLLIRFVQDGPAPIVDYGHGICLCVSSRERRGATGHSIRRIE